MGVKGYCSVSREALCYSFETSKVIFNHCCKRVLKPNFTEGQSLTGGLALEFQQWQQHGIKSELVNKYKMLAALSEYIQTCM